jgi:hypothetical protein
MSEDQCHYHTDYITVRSALQGSTGAPCATTGTPCDCCHVRVVFGHSFLRQQPEAELEQESHVTVVQIQVSESLDALQAILERRAMDIQGLGGVRGVEVDLGQNAQRFSVIRAFFMVELP